LESKPFFELFSPFTLICFALTLAFGGLGLSSKDSKISSSFLDIAKIFAGALVGSTTSNISKQVRTKN
jgi:hypothetical protein